MSKLYKIWFQENPAGYLNDPATKTALITLNPRQYRGIYNFLLALRFPAEMYDYENAADAEDAPDYPNSDMSTYTTIGTEYTYVDNPATPLYGANVRFRNQAPYRALFLHPYGANSYFIIPYSSPEELQGIFTILQWLGFDPKQYLNRIEDRQGNKYTV